MIPISFEITRKCKPENNLLPQFVCQTQLKEGIGFIGMKITVYMCCYLI